jgi:RHS repeat-associated protein
VGPEQEPVEEHAFAYDATNRRVAHDVKRTAGSDAPSLESTIYVGAGYERTRIDGIDRHVTRVMAPDGTTISIEQVEGADAAVRYNFTDRLGSVYAVTDENGVILEKRGYRPFGDESRSAGLGETTGFTGHEQDRDLGLINMGGRMYDPSLGRFLTADPVIADPMHSLSFNAYSYVNNRPLDFTDPSGFQAADVAPPPPPPPPPPAPLPGDPWVYVETGTWVPDDSSGTRSQRSSGGATAQQAAPAPASGESKGAINAGAQSAAAGPASPATQGRSIFAMLPPAPAFNPFFDSPERRQVAEQQAQWFRHQADRARERAEHQRGLGLRPEEIPHYVMTLAGVVLFDQLANIVADPDAMLSMVPLPGVRAAGVGGWKSRRAFSQADSGLKDHARRHSNLSPADYLARGQENIRSGRMLKGGGRHPDTQYWVRRVGENDYSLTITNRNGEILSIDTWRSGGGKMTRETITHGLSRSGVTPPQGFWEGF